MRQLMDGLLIATGFTGGLTLLWLIRLVSNLFRSPPTVIPHFSPGGGCTDVLVREIGTARREVILLASTLANRPVAQALIDARLRGAAVEILLDPAGPSDAQSDIRFLLEQGLTPKLNDRPGLAHQSVLIDNKTLLQSSFPLSNRSDGEHAGSFLVFRGHPDLVEAFRQEFVKHLETAHPINGPSTPPVSPPKTPVQTTTPAQTVSPPQTSTPAPSSTPKVTTPAATPPVTAPKGAAPTPPSVVKETPTAPTLPPITSTPPKPTPAPGPQVSPVAAPTVVPKPAPATSPTPAPASAATATSAPATMLSRPVRYVTEPAEEKSLPVVEPKIATEEPPSDRQKQNMSTWRETRPDLVTSPAQTVVEEDEDYDDHDEDSDLDDSSQGMVTTAAADLFARLRQQLAEREKAPEEVPGAV